MCSQKRWSITNREDSPDKLTLFARNLGSPWVFHNRELILKKVLKDLKATRVIDVGCADGGYSTLLFSHLNASFLVGVDLSKDELHLAKRQKGHLNSEYARVDVTALPFSTSTFDLVFSKDLLHHLSKPLRTLCEFKRVLKLNGTIVIVETERNNPLMMMYIKHGHNHYTLTQLSALAERAELKDFRVKQVSAYPHHFLFWSGNPLEFLWDVGVIIFLSFCYVFPSATKYLAKLFSSMTSHSYNIILWRQEN
jgi:SAM-dependent methyltransferase